MKKIKRGIYIRKVAKKKEKNKEKKHQTEVWCFSSNLQHFEQSNDIQSVLGCETIFLRVSKISLIPSLIIVFVSVATWGTIFTIMTST